MILKQRLKKLTAVFNGININICIFILGIPNVTVIARMYVII